MRVEWKISRVFSSPVFRGRWLLKNQTISRRFISDESTIHYNATKDRSPSFILFEELKFLENNTMIDKDIGKDFYSP